MPENKSCDRSDGYNLSDKGDGMNRKDTKGLRVVMHHYDSGGEVQKQYKRPGLSSHGGWYDDEYPVWDHETFRYRRIPPPAVRPWTMAIGRLI